MIVRLANEFARRGYPVELVVLRPEGENLREVGSELHLIDLKVGALLLAPLAIRRYLRESRPAVLISAIFYANLLAALAKLLSPGSRTRLVLTERNMLSVHVNYSQRRSRHLFKPAARLLYRVADRVVGISRGVADDIASITGLPASKVSFIHNPAMAPDTLELSRRPAEPELLSPSGEPTLITLGRLEAQKDHATLLRAFARIQATHPSRLIILGQGSLRAELEALVAGLGLQDRVLLPGYLDNPLPHLRAADLFVLSSLYEGFGNVLVEALACGLPVVSTDCPSGPAEILADGEFGRLVAPADEQALAAALREALDAPRDPERQLARAQEFTLERCADRFEALALELIDS